MDTSTISLIVSGFVGVVSGLSFLNTLSARKEAGLERFAKADAVSLELIVIRKDINNISAKLEDHGNKISQLQTHSAVLNSQMEQQLKEAEKISDKIDKWRDDE